MAAWTYISEVISRIPQDALDFVELKDILVAMVLWAILYRVHKTKNRHRQMQRMRLEAKSAIYGGLQTSIVVLLFLLLVYSPYQHYQELNNKTVGVEKHAADLQNKIAERDTKIAEMNKELVSPTAIYMECTMASLPLTIAPSESIHIIPLNKRRLHSVKWGFMDFHNSGPLARLWPEKKVMAEADKKHNFARFVWRCEVSNHGTLNVLDVGIPIKIWFGNEKPETVYQAIVTPLDAASKFVFYPINDCPENISAVWPDTVTLQVLGESKRREVPLRRKFRNIADQIMTFFGSTTRFIGGEPCE